MNNYRLTVHVTDQPRVDTRAPRVAPQQKGEQKSIVDRAREQAAKDRPNTKHDENKQLHIYCFHIHTRSCLVANIAHSMCFVKIQQRYLLQFCDP